jgi:transmembrane sensor
MTKIIPMPDQTKHHVEASQWLSSIDAGLDETEKHEFQAWLTSNVKNRDAFQYLAHLWDDMDDLSRLADIFPDDGQVERKHSGASWSIAASIAVVLISITLYVGKGYMHQGDLVKSYETSIGEHSSVNLPDGSVLVLNTNSLAKVSYKDAYRLITLERGEINIDVAHDESRPLSVKAGDNVVQAVGTAFNIELLADSKFELIVTDGQVRVGDRKNFEVTLARIPRGPNSAKLTKRGNVPVRLDEDSLSISKGERIVISAQNLKGVENFPTAPSKIAEFEIQAALSWRQGNLTFIGESLENAISEISRYTSVKFEFDSEELKNVRIAGMFKSGDVNGLLLALEDSFNISSQKLDEEKYRLYR